jgi:hypothetical protein
MSVVLGTMRLVSSRGVPRGASWKSWGEAVAVQPIGDPAQPVATVSSRPKVRTTLIDHGRGRRNVDHVVRALSTGT